MRGTGPSLSPLLSFFRFFASMTRPRNLLITCIDKPFHSFSCRLHSILGPLNIGGEVGWDDRKKCSDTSFGGPAKNVRIETDLLTKPQNLFGQVPKYQKNRQKSPKNFYKVSQVISSCNTCKVCWRGDIQEQDCTLLSSRGNTYIWSLNVRVCFTKDSFPLPAWKH